YSGMDGRVIFHSLPVAGPLGYVANTYSLWKLLRDVKPDLVNVHYATSYGLLARMAGFHPTLLSAWGSDVFDFPGKSRLHRKLVTDNLLFADGLASTSEAMGRQVKWLLGFEREVFITPFGVDCEKFHPSLKEKTPAEIVVGTVKTLKSTYGI